MFWSAALGNANAIFVQCFAYWLQPIKSTILYDLSRPFWLCLGAAVRCIGRLIGQTGQFRILDMKSINLDDEMALIHRLEAICNFELSKMLSNTKKWHTQSLWRRQAIDFGGFRNRLFSIKCHFFHWITTFYLFLPFFPFCLYFFHPEKWIFWTIFSCEFFWKFLEFFDYWIKFPVFGPNTIL